jgi:hypothetical protein
VAGPRTAAAPAQGRRQRVVLLAGFMACALAIAVAAVVVKPTTARAFHLIYGSMFVDDNTAPVAIDLASGRPTVRLSNAFQAVSATVTGELDVVPLAGSTLMLNANSGEFNMLDNSGLHLQRRGHSCRLGRAGLHRP